jgi:hypothetical protein
MNKDFISELKRMTIDEIREQIEFVRSDIKKESKTSYLYTYPEDIVPDLVEYLALLESEILNRTAQ